MCIRDRFDTKLTFFGRGEHLFAMAAARRRNHMTQAAVVRAEHVFKLLVTGPFAAGKTSLIQAVSQTPVVGTDVETTGAESGVKSHTTVAMDFGSYALHDES